VRVLVDSDILIEASRGKNANRKHYPMKELTFF